MGSDEISAGRYDGNRRPSRLPPRLRAALVGALSVGIVGAAVLLGAPSLLGAPPTPSAGATGPSRPVTAPSGAASAPTGAPARVAGSDGADLATPPAVAAAPAPPRPVGEPGSGTSPVSVAARCPLATNHSNRLVVRFLISNDTSTTLRVLGVRAVLPLRGLRPRGVSVMRADCERWLPDGQPDSVLPPGGSRAVTMQFAVGSTCPWPFPVQARVRVRPPAAPAGIGSAGSAGSNQSLRPARSVTLAVWSDLGGAAFDQCRAP